MLSCFPGADGEVSTERGAVHTDTKAYSWFQLPLCRDNAGGSNISAHHTTTSRPGMTC